LRRLARDCHRAHSQTRRRPRSCRAGARLREPLLEYAKRCATISMSASRVSHSNCPAPAHAERINEHATLRGFEPALRTPPPSQATPSAVTTQHGFNRRQSSKQTHSGSLMRNVSKQPGVASSPESERQPPELLRRKYRRGTSPRLYSVIVYRDASFQRNTMAGFGVLGIRQKRSASTRRNRAMGTHVLVHTYSSESAHTP
jgi:hypothetical protein